MGIEVKRFRDFGYLVYSDGRIWSEYYNCFLRYTDNGIGYMQVGISFGSKGNRHKKKLYVHRVIAEVFVDNPESKSSVNHKNGNKRDNRAENLEWVSHRENMNHAIATGLVPINIDNWIFKEKLPVEPRRRFTDEQAEEMRLLKIGGMSYVEIGKKYGCTDATARCAANGQDGYKIKGVSPIELDERKRYVGSMEKEWKLEMDRVKRAEDRVKLTWVRTAVYLDENAFIGQDTKFIFQ